MRPGQKFQRFEKRECWLILLQKKEEIMLTKEKMVATIAELPADVSLDEVLERLIVLDKIERGMQDIRAGRFISQDEMEKLVKTWHTR